MFLFSRSCSETMDTMHTPHTCSNLCFQSLHRDRAKTRVHKLLFVSCNTQIIGFELSIILAIISNIYIRFIQSVSSLSFPRLQACIIVAILSDFSQRFALINYVFNSVSISVFQTTFFIKSVYDVFLLISRILRL